MVQRALALGVKADYILMDSWFSFPAILAKLGQHLPVICMAKHHLNLEKEAQLRSYDGIVGHITITMVRYIFLAYEQRCHDDPKTIGDLFFACSDEMDDLSFAEALQRLLALVMDEIRSSGNYAESTILAMIDTIMGAAIDFIKSGQRLLGNNIVNSTL